MTGNCRRSPLRNKAIQCRQIEGEAVGCRCFSSVQACSGLLAVSLTVSVGRMRMQKKIYLGDGGDPEMLSAIRAHGNFMEYVPLCLALIYFASDYYGYGPSRSPRWCC